MVLNARVKSPDNAVFVSSAGHDPAGSCFILEMKTFAMQTIQDDV